MNKQNYVESIKAALAITGIQNLLNDYQKFFPPYPARFNKPVLKNISTATAAEVHEFGQKLVEYEAKVKVFNAEKEEYEKIKRQVEDIIIEEMKMDTGFYGVVPEKNQAKVWAKAWEDGHAHGYYSVYQALDSLVELFS